MISTLRYKLENAQLRLRLLLLWLRNRFSGQTLLSQHGPVVSLTTHGPRLRTVYFTLESIGLGVLLPSRLVLWLDDPAAIAKLPAALKRLQARGLEIRLTQNYGPHTKYYPALDLLAHQEHMPLVTADDDILYPRHWLEGLSQAHAQYPRCINAYRAHVIAFSGDALAPYSLWGPCLTTSPSFRHFATGVSGVIYPPIMLKQLREAGSAFMGSCPKADDLWLHCIALRAGLPVRQINPVPIHFPVVPSTQHVGLMHSNLFGGANDQQIQNLYQPADLRKLVLATVPEPTAKI